MTTALQQTYEEFPYQSNPIPQSHPDRLATIGCLFGMNPAPLESCRVLELGCASGGNLLPMAMSLPNAEFVGIDFSPVQIRQGIADVDALGLANVRLIAMDLMDFSEEFGKFDYIIAHGVYSWVPSAVREKLLAICGTQLAPAGIAYVSYNTLPGWRMRSMVRDAMIYHTRGIADPAARVAQARAVLEFLAESVKDDPSAYASTLRSEADHLRTQGDYYVLHDHLEIVNEPVYFHEFIDGATRHGLAYLGEADFAAMLGRELAGPVKETLARVAPDVLKREQFLDFLRGRTFRESLLVRAGVELTRKVSPLRVMSLRIASNAVPAKDAPDVRSNAVVEFRTPEGKAMNASRPMTKAALRVLAERWPVAATFDDLYAAARARIKAPDAATEEGRAIFASEVLQGYAAGALELRHAPSPFVLDVGEHPKASALARLQAQRGEPATNLRHTHGTINADTLRLFVLLDGTRTRREIVAALWPAVPQGEAMQVLDAALAQLARLALIVQ